MDWFGFLNCYGCGYYQSQCDVAHRFYYAINRTSQVALVKVFNNVESVVGKHKNSTKLGQICTVCHFLKLAAKLALCGFANQFSTAPVYDFSTLYTSTMQIFLKCACKNFQLALRPSLPCDAPYSKNYSENTSLFLSICCGEMLRIL